MKRSAHERVQYAVSFWTTLPDIWVVTGPSRPYSNMTDLQKCQQLIMFPTQFGGASCIRIEDRTVDYIVQRKMSVFVFAEALFRSILRPDEGQ